MRVTVDTPDMLVVRFTRWKAPLVYAVLTVFSLWVAVWIVRIPDVGIGTLLFWLLITVSWTLPMALIMAEKSMLVLNAVTGQAELRHRDIRGLHRHHWPLDEVQSTRVTRIHTNGSAENDPKRRITLFVRSGMDEGRHKLTHHPVEADDALAASAKVSDWMREWRKTHAAALDSRGAQA